MTEFDTHAPRTTSPRSSHTVTIYRDTPLTFPATRALRLNHSSLHTLARPEEHAGQWMMLGLAAVTFPAVAYSLAQLWNLVSGGALEHAVRAFVP